MDLTTETLAVSRGPYGLHAELTPGTGTPVVLMHGFPDNTHLYDRLLPHLAGRSPVVRFDFLGWGRSDKPQGYPYTAANQVGDLDTVVQAVATDQVVLVAHDASGPPAIDWALANPSRVARLVLLNTYYHWMPGLRRPPAIALYSTPVVRALARAVQPPPARRRATPFRPAGTGDLRAHDRYLNPRVARRLAALFPNSDLYLLDNAGHYVQVDEPRQVADLILAE